MFNDYRNNDKSFFIVLVVRFKSITSSNFYKLVIQLKYLDSIYVTFEGKKLWLEYYIALNFRG